MIIAVTMTFVVSLVCLCCCCTNMRERIANCLCGDVMKQAPKDMRVSNVTSNQSVSKVIREIDIDSKLQIK